MRLAHGLPLLCLLCLSTALARAAPEEKQDTPTWQPIELLPTPPKSLTDHRSPVLASERSVPSGARIDIGSESIRLTLRTGGRSVTWERLGRSPKGAKVPGRGTLALPGLLALPDLGGRRYSVCVRAAPTANTLLVSSALGLDLPLRQGTGRLVDTDFDGLLGSAGDGYVAPASRTVGAWRGEGWTAQGGRRFRQREDGSWESAEIPPPHPGNADHAAAWSLLQWRRQQCGLHALAYGFALEDGMRKHAEYLAADDSEAHRENPANDRYSPEGDRAAKNCVIGFEEASTLSGLEMQFATLYHRSRPLQPGLTRTALVFHKGFFLLDVFSHRGGPLAKALLVYPPHGMQDVMLRFHRSGERPMPVPEEAARNTFLGTAINLFSEDLRLLESLPASPTIEATQGPRRKAVPGYAHHPGHPPNTRVGLSNRGNVALVPSKPLKARSRYDCVAVVHLPGGTTIRYRWWFETAKPTRRRGRRR